MLNGNTHFIAGSVVGAGAQTYVLPFIFAALPLPPSQNSKSKNPLLVTPGNPW
jgi:hypothetical protein